MCIQFSDLYKWLYVCVCVGSDEKPFGVGITCSKASIPPPQLPRSLETGTKRPDCIRQAFDQLSSIVFLSVIDSSRIPDASSATSTRGKS